MMDELTRLKWQCRRGMLELDLLLQPFAELYYSQLGIAEQHNFKRLLECSDLQLFTWLMRGEDCPDPGLGEIVSLIRERHQVPS